MKIKKGDKVKVLIGKDRSREGLVLQSIPKNQTVLVQGINLYKKHLKSTKNQKGGIVEKERPLKISKVALICPNCKKVCRVAYKIDQAGDKYRTCKKCQQPISSTSTK